MDVAKRLVGVLRHGEKTFRKTQSTALRGELCQLQVEGDLGAVCDVKRGHAKVGVLPCTALTP